MHDYPRTVMSYAKAIVLVEKLNGEGEDGWSYAVDFLNPDHTRCAVVVTDEAGDMVGYL